MDHPIPNNRQVIIAIINHKPELSDYEKISLRQCLNVLGNYPIWMVVPESLDISRIKTEFDSLRILRVKDRYLSNYRNFNRFKINPMIYRYFSQYEYLLYYELDAFVFADFLKYWCTQGYDFIGAPWLSRLQSGNIRFDGVGNGGFSLRRISAHLSVLYTYKKCKKNSEILASYRMLNIKGKIRYFPQLLMLLIGLKGNTHWWFNDYEENEDKFWSQAVPIAIPDFKVADPMTALKFSFELLPEELYKLNDQQLPFGCHSWYKDEQLSFWKQFIEKEGHSVEL